MPAPVCMPEPDLKGRGACLNPTSCWTTQRTQPEPHGPCVTLAAHVVCVMCVWLEGQKSKLGSSCCMQRQNHAQVNGPIHRSLCRTSARGCWMRESVQNLLASDRKPNAAAAARLPRALQLGTGRVPHPPCHVPRKNKQAPHARTSCAPELAAASGARSPTASCAPLMSSLNHHA